MDERIPTETFSRCPKTLHLRIGILKFLFNCGKNVPLVHNDTIRYDTIRYDTIVEFNVDSKAEYSALSSTRSQKKKLKNNASAPLIQYRIRTVKSVRKEQE